jgi:hypothetical protein
VDGPELDRRRLLVGAGLAGSAAALSACGVYAETEAETSPDTPAGDVDERPEAEAPDPDVAVLISLLEVERGLVAGYSDVIGGLEGELRATARHFLEQESAHAKRLEDLIEKLGGRVPKEPPRAALLRKLPKGRGLQMITAAERRAVAAYGDGLAQLRDRRIRQVVASIVTTEAEHITVLLGARGLDPVPTPFVTGAEHGA